MGREREGTDWKQGVGKETQGKEMEGWNGHDIQRTGKAWQKTQEKNKNTIKIIEKARQEGQQMSGERKESPDAKKRNVNEQKPRIQHKWEEGKKNA